jgi:hypothetical protein
MNKNYLIMTKLYGKLLAFLFMLIIPFGASAQQAKLHFWNGTTVTDKVMGGWTGSGWTQEFTGDELSDYVSGNNNQLNFLPHIDCSGDNYYKSASAFDNGTSATFSKDGSGDSHVNMPANFQSYIFTFKVENWTNNGNTIKVTVSWRSNDKFELLTSGGTWKQVTSGVQVYNTSFPIQIRKTVSGTTSYFSSVSSTLTDGTALTTTLTPDASQATEYTTTESDAYGFTLDITDNSITLHKTGDANSYYFVSPELTSGQRLPAFRLIPSRMRHGGALSTILFSLNLKDDAIKRILSGPTTIHYHIEKGDGTQSYRPYANNYNLGTASSRNNTTNNNVMYQQYNDTKTSGSTTNEFALATGTGVSYTWLFDASGNAPLKLEINKASLVESSSKTYYAIGNYGDAHATANIHPYEVSGRAKMNRLLYFKDRPGIGMPDATTDFDATRMDSVVYRVTIPRPAYGWGELYMAVADASLVEGSTVTNWGTNWDKVIRPQVQDYGTPASVGEGASGMDATALEGGVFWGDNATNKSQALNPQLTTQYANATSYTFSVNLTTSTYRISFNTEQMYIMGSAIAASNAGVENVTNIGSIPTGHNVYALPLTWDDNEQCFKYIKDGVETAIVMNNNDATTGNRFRFVYAKDFTNPWFGENADNTQANSEQNPNMPADITTSDKAYTAYGPNYDTQYVNYLQTYQSSKNEYGDPTKDIKFLLPIKKDGTGYIIRFYMKKVGDNVDYFYTINRKIGFTKWDNLTSSLADGYDYYRAFSEWHAMKKPEDVKVYTLSSVDETNKTAQLTELTTDYIPAHTGVIMVSKQSSVPFETYTENPEETKMGDGVTNLLAAQEDNTTLQRSEVVDGTTYYNYIFKYVANDEGKNVIGFYAPTQKKVGRNFAYLRSTFNAYGNGTAQGAKAGFRLFFDDWTTGIENIPTADHTEDNAYYNIQGVKISKPTTKGIYIHNGKKFIIR